MSFHSEFEVSKSLPQTITGFLKKNPVIVQLMRFGAIGFLNTALNFLILNPISKSLDVSSGIKLGAIATFSFAIATTQSYFWNRQWTFAHEKMELHKIIIRLLKVSILGVGTFAMVVLGSKFHAPPYYYVILLLGFLILEFVLWKTFGFSRNAVKNEGNPFFLFIFVSLIGLFINFTVVSQVSAHFLLSENPDLNKNIATIIATAVTLFWNFCGYKIFVFKN